MSKFRDDVLAVYKDMKPDIAENQVVNKGKLGGLYDGIGEHAEDKDDPDKKLAELLEMKYHYFDVGYECRYTPEELDAAIKKELEK